MKADFSGYASKAGLKCTDGRTISPDAFKHQDQERVPLVWQHGHTDPENVLGHAILEYRPDGTYTYGFFNNTPKARHAAELLEHGDINRLSIWANKLIERGSLVLHGAIREVSLVLAGANPGAVIESVTIRHSDGEEMDLDDEAIIYTDLPLEHADPPAAGDSEETLQDVYDSMNEKQKNVLHYMLGAALEEAGANSTQHSDEDENNLEHNNKEGNEMTGKRNVFENKEKVVTGHTLSHSDMKGILEQAIELKSLKAAVEEYALAHGIDDIDILFPDAKTITNTPEFVARRMEWVSAVMSGVKKSPFSRVKSLFADLTLDSARAKGYVKGALKKEEFFRISRRVTTPQTVYKKQKLDRDDVIDITDFDVVAWMRGEMRVMLEEEVARAILFGDGREIDDEDKIKEEHIRPIATDDDFYSVKVYVNLDDASSNWNEFVDAAILNRRHYRGTGTPTFFTTEETLARILIMRDEFGHRIYKNAAELAVELRVDRIVTVEAMEGETDIIGIMVNLEDYNVGADRGGAVSMFDDFDIDYNQLKYLMETRFSGALIRPRSALVFIRTAGSSVLVTPAAPTFDPDTLEITVVDTAHVVYRDEDGNVINAAGSPYDINPLTHRYTVRAEPASGYHFANTADDEWVFEDPDR